MTIILVLPRKYPCGVMGSLVVPVGLKTRQNFPKDSPKNPRKTEDTSSSSKRKTAREETEAKTWRQVQNYMGQHGIQVGTLHDYDNPPSCPVFGATKKKPEKQASHNSSRALTIDLTFENASSIG